MNRIKKKLKELADIKNGSTPSTNHPEFYDGDIVWITPKDLSIQKKKYISIGERTITEAGLKSCSSTLIPEGSILLSSRAPIGLTAIATCTLCTNQGFKNIVPDTNKLNNEYLYYYIKTKIKEIEALGSGTTFKEVSKSTLENYELTIHEDIEEQKKIASALSTIDDKIELNNKINSELEAMAKELYDYWFIQFDFPRLHNGTCVNYKSSGGEMEYNQILKREIPQGWRVENFKKNSLTNLIKPGIDAFDGTKTYLATADVINNDINFNASKIAFENRESRANMQPIENSLRFAKMKNSKKILYFGKYSKKFMNQFILSTGFAGLKCKSELSLEYMWLSVNNDGFETIKDRLSNGATQEAINNDSMAFIPLIIPPEEILKEFHKQTRAIYHQIYLNQLQNRDLANLRDFLLPMLINGQVKIS